MDGGRMGKKRFKISLTALGLLGSVGAGLLMGREEVRIWLSLIPAIVIHEAGHLVAAKICGAGISGMKLDLFGARLALSSNVSYAQEFFIALCGPLANFLSAVAAYGSWGASVLCADEAVGVFFGASLTLGLFNLLPVGTMDGGRMLAAFLSGVWSPTAAYVCLRITTAVLLMGLWLLSAYALLMGAGMMTLFVFSLCMLFRLLSHDPDTAEI